MSTEFSSQSNKSNLPTQKWQSNGNKFVDRSEEFLWTKDGKQALKYLHSLGLNDETLRKYRIGYNPECDFIPLKVWGLPESYNVNGNLSKIWLPSGVVIPCIIENMIRSIKIRRYLTKEQISKDEQSDISIRGSMSGLFGAENLRRSLCIVLTDNELDAMFLDQYAGYLVGAATFGKAAKGIRAVDWGLWGHYLLSVADILVLYKANEEEKKIIADSLPVYSRRTHRAYLPNIPGVQFLSDLKKQGVDPKDWLMQTLSTLGLLEDMTNPKSWISHISGVSTSETLMKVDISDVSSYIEGEDFTGAITPIRKLVTINLNAHQLFDATIMPATLCHACQNDKYWQRSDGGWVCDICHPDPKNSVTCVAWLQ